MTSLPGNHTEPTSTTCGLGVSPLTETGPTPLFSGEMYYVDETIRGHHARYWLADIGVDTATNTTLTALIWIPAPIYRSLTFRDVGWQRTVRDRLARRANELGQPRPAVFVMGGYNDGHPLSAEVFTRRSRWNVSTEMNEGTILSAIVSQLSDQGWLCARERYLLRRCLRHPPKPYGKVEEAWQDDFETMLSQVLLPATGGDGSDAVETPTSLHQGSDLEDLLADMSRFNAVIHSHFESYIVTPKSREEIAKDVTPEAARMLGFSSVREYEEDARSRVQQHARRLKRWKDFRQLVRDNGGPGECRRRRQSDRGMFCWTLLP